MGAGRGVMGGMIRFVMLFVLVFCAASYAQTGGDDLRISLMTVGPGGRAYEKFGHNQIWVHDGRAGTDIAYNYGVFDFEQESFVWRFVQGRMLYRCEGVDAALIEQAYREAYPEFRNRPAEFWLSISYMADDRSVWVQDLNLSTDQKRTLADFLAWNALPENQQYRYDYYRDNCSTRVRDALDRPGVLDGLIAGGLRGEATETTYRWHTRRLTRMDLPLYAVIYALLGEPVDQPIDAWDETFLPVKLMERLRGVEVADESGAMWPLVSREYELYRSKLYSEPDAPPRWYWASALLLGIMLGTLVVSLGRLSERRRIARWLGAFTIVGWSLTAGVFGAIMTWAWFTDHSAGWWNENWLALNPLSLGLVVLGPMVIFKNRWNRAAVGLALVVVALAAIAVLIQMFSRFGQVNGEVLWLAVPMHVGVWGALRMACRSYSSRSA